MTTPMPDDTPSAERTNKTTPWGAYVFFLIIGAFIGVYLIDNKIEPLEKRISTLETKAESYEKRLTAFEQQLTMTDARVASLALSSSKTDPDAYLDLGNPNTYEDLGSFWQVKGLVVRSDPQGCRIDGDVLYRLNVRRQNVDMSVELLSEDFKTLANGKSVLRDAIPGRYTSFSFVVLTDAKLSDVKRIHLRINESSGTTSAAY